AVLNKSAEQPARIEVSLNAPEMSDFWSTESPDRFAGPLQLNGQLEWRNGVANGQLSLYGAGLKTRDLTFHQLSSQIIVAESVAYLNDFTATLNDQDFAAANAIVDLRPPHK